MKLGIRGKTLAGFLAVVALLLTVGGVGYFSIANVAQSADDIERAGNLDDGGMQIQLALFRARGVEVGAIAQVLAGHDDGPGAVAKRAETLAAAWDQLAYGQGS